MPGPAGERIIVMDKGTGTGHRLLRRIRELGVFSAAVPLAAGLDTSVEPLPTGVVIVQDGPAADSGAWAEAWRQAGVPVLTAAAGAAADDGAGAGGPTDQELRTFLFDICGCHGDWTPGSSAAAAVNAIAQRVGQGRVVAGVSGGVDSTVAAVLVHRAIGPRLTCIFVDHGLLRQGEAEEVPRLFRGLGLNLVQVDAGAGFLAALDGVTDPETKRHRIGAEFIRVFEAEARRLGAIDFLLQGTLYTDVLESGALTGTAIKTHHNVGGLPADMALQLLEPLRYFFKDEVRQVGTALGLPHELIWRQPFPGPGLAIRLLGAVTPDRLATLRHADAIMHDEIERAGLNEDIWQFFAVLPGARAVGTMAGERTYGEAVILRAVTGRDAVTADWARLPHELLARLSDRLLAQVPGVTRVVYDITAKPPGTIEWE